MKEYEFAVTFGITYGTFYEEAKNFDEAYDKACATIRQALVDLPVTVEFDVECVNEPDDWNLECILEAVDDALCEHGSDFINVVYNEETEKLDVMYCSDNNSFAIEVGVVYLDDIDVDDLLQELNERNVGYVGL